MDFSNALKLIQSGSKVTRTDWKDAHLAVSFSDNGNIVTRRGEAPAVLFFPNQEDLLSRDWELVR